VVQRQLVKDHIRQSILDAAAELLIARGDSAIMAELADAAGIGRATLYRYFELEIERPSLPRVEAWYDRLSSRPAYREHVMIPFDDLKGRLAF